jgi:hypothetical protein
MHRRSLLAVTGALFAGGCSTLLGGQSPSDREPSSRRAECGDATITSVSVTASTAGDTLAVEGEVSDTPAPDLRGFIVEDRDPENPREITIQLESTGRFEYEFEYAHHGICDYGVWLDGCAPELTPEPATNC